jgi:hypothetical protein
MRGCFEADAACQLAQLITTDDEFPSLSVDMTEAGLRRDDSIESARFYRAVDETAFTNW